MKHDTDRVQHQFLSTVSKVLQKILILIEVITSLLTYFRKCDSSNLMRILNVVWRKENERKILFSAILHSKYENMFFA